MKNTMSTIAIVGGLILSSPLTARAQTPASDGPIFANISLGGQFQTSTFSPITSFDLFNETGTVTANQTVGSGLVFDITGGYRVWRDFAAAVGISTFNGSGSAAALAAIPNPLFRGKPTLFPFTPADYGDLKQSTVAVNFQVVWMKALTDRFDLAVFGGPSVIRVKQEFASATAVLNSVAAVETQSKTTAKAGTAGVDLSYRMTDRYGVGGFIRYAGGQADFPAISSLQVGGVQAAGGIRIRF